MMAGSASRAARTLRMAWKPEGYTSVSPYPVVDGAQRTIDFLVTVLDAERMAGWPPIASHVHLHPPDVDATWSRAPAVAAEPVQAPEENGDGDRRGGFRDVGGTTWWISTRVA